MIFNDADGMDEEYFKRIREQKEVEMEDRRRTLINRTDIKRRLRQQQIKRKEIAETEKIKQIQESTKLKVRQLEVTERLAKELSRRKHFELQQALKCRKKKSAVPSVTTEKICAELMKEIQHDEETQTSVAEWSIGKEITEAERQKKKFSYKKDLQNQLINNYHRLREEEEEKHRERKIMEETGETMHKEDIEAEKRKQETVAMLQAEKKAFLKVRELWKQKRKEVLRQEHDEIYRLVAIKETEEKKKAEKKTDTQAAKDALVDKLSKKLIEEERKKIERDELCRELYLAEKEDELTRQAMKVIMEKKQTAKELLEHMARQRMIGAEKKAKENEIDAAFVKYLADERKNLDEKKMKEEQARRERNIQYGKDLREAIAITRLKRMCDAKEEAKNDAERKKTSYFTWSTDEDDRDLKCTSEPALEA